MDFSRRNLTKFLEINKITGTICGISQSIYPSLNVSILSTTNRIEHVKWATAWNICNPMMANIMYLWSMRHSNIIIDYVPHKGAYVTILISMLYHVKLKFFDYKSYGSTYFTCLISVGCKQLQNTTCWTCSFVYMLFHI